MEFHPIGTIHTPFRERDGMPIQPAGAREVEGRIDLGPEYEEGLRDLDGFSHVVLLYHLHRSRGFELSVVPFLDTEPRGLFSTRAPRRPNAIGLSVVELLRVEGPTLHVRGVDILDGTPLLDIKPYVPDFDGPTEFRLGWLEEARKKAGERRADDRFA